MGLLEHAEIETLCPNVQSIQTSQQGLSKGFSGFNVSFVFRSYHKLYTDLFNAESSKVIRNISGCLKPCHSKEYKQVSLHIYKTDRINTNTNTNTNSGLSNDQILHFWERGLLHQCLDCVFRHHPTDDVFDEKRVVADL